MPWPFSRSRAMPGGVVFGPAGWMPSDMIRSDAGLPGLASLGHEQVARAPASREELIQVLTAIGLHAASAIVPSLIDQVKDLEHRHCRALVVDLLPTQPEFALPSALTALAIEDLRAGLGAIQRAMNAQRVVAALDKHDRRTRRLWKLGAKGHRPGHEGTAYEIRGLVNRYPQGHPTPLLRSLFGRRLQVGHLPSGQGRLIVDPVTLWALGRWVRAGEKFTHRPVQIFCDEGCAADRKHAAPILVLARLGRAVPDLLAEFHIKTENKQIIINGMLSGEESQFVSDHGADGPVAPTPTVTATTEAIAVREPPVCEMPAPCISCGWCVDICPTSLMPVNLMELAEQAQRFVAAVPLGPGGSLPLTGDPLRTRAAREAIHCIGCGLCSYVCPSRLPLMRQTLRLREWVLAESRR